MTYSPSEKNSDSVISINNKDPEFVKKGPGIFVKKTQRNFGTGTGPGISVKKTQKRQVPVSRIQGPTDFFKVQGHNCTVCTETRESHLDPENL